MSARPALRWVALVAFVWLTAVGLVWSSGAPLLTALAIVSGIGAWFGALIGLILWLDLP